MKSLMSLWHSMADDCAMLCRTSATTDKITVSRRFEHEGLSFLTIVLPDLGKATQKWLDQGQVGINSSFSKGRGSLPLFLGGFFCQVFDPENGVLLDEPSIDAIFSIRQLTLSFGKISFPCTDRRVRKAMRGFIKCEQEVRQADSALSKRNLAEFSKMSALLFQEAFSRVDRDIYYDYILPKHGPGSVADGLTSNGKYRMPTWTSRLDSLFQVDRYVIPNHSFLSELDDVDVLEPGSEIPVKVISVPKTLKTPRIIAVEPSCMQYAQQGILQVLLDSLGRDRLLSRFLGFDNQSPNQEMARLGSREGTLATLDLSDASDRVSNQLVRAMTNRWPYLQQALDVTRSRKAAVPGHGVIRLAKFASMGSALCFPVEAMVFLTIIFLGIQKSLNTPLTKKDVRSFLGSVRVYGDDLIVPTDHVLSIVQALELFGAKVGLDKSFWTGRFRESCGKEYFNGHDVSITRVRQALPSTIADATGVISTVSLRNQLYEFGFEKTVESLDNRLKKMLKHFPVVGPDSPVLGRVSHTEAVMPQRVHPSLQIPLVRGFVVEAKAPKDPLGDTGALLKCLLKLEYRGNTRVSVLDNRLIPASALARHDIRSSLTAGNVMSSFGLTTQSQDGKHLERSGRPKRVDIKLGWWSPV